MELIIGAAVSIFIQFIKNVVKLGEYGTLVAVLAVSIVAAGVYSYLVAAGFWGDLVPILTTAGAFYTFIIQRFE